MRILFSEIEHFVMALKTVCSLKKNRIVNERKFRIVDSVIKLLKYCCYGKAQWLFFHFPNILLVNIHTSSCQDEAFRQACEEGHFDIVIWLYSIGEIDIHARENYAFTLLIMVNWS